MATINRVPFPSLKLGALLGSGATGEVFSGALEGAPVAVKRLKLAASPTRAQSCRGVSARRWRCCQSTRTPASCLT
jgi:hypothetical protein